MPAVRGGTHALRARGDGVRFAGLKTRSEKCGVWGARTGADPPCSRISYNITRLSRHSAIHGVSVRRKVLHSRTIAAELRGD
eukprot:5560883-Prymnesium_polylepis.1